jgi:hypothetical protein
MQLDKRKRNIYLATLIIITGLSFMIVTGYYITSGVSGGSSVEIAIDKEIDDCYAEKGLD